MFRVLVPPRPGVVVRSGVVTAGRANVGGGGASRADSMTCADASPQQLYSQKQLNNSIKTIALPTQVYSDTERSLSEPAHGWCWRAPVTEPLGAETLATISIAQQELIPTSEAHHTRVMPDLSIRCLASLYYLRISLLYVVFITLVTFSLWVRCRSPGDRRIYPEQWIPEFPAAVLN